MVVHHTWKLCWDQVWWTWTWYIASNIWQAIFQHSSYSRIYIWITLLPAYVMVKINSLHLETISDFTNHLSQIHTIQPVRYQNVTRMETAEARGLSTMRMVDVIRVMQHQPLYIYMHTCICACIPGKLYMKLSSHMHLSDRVAGSQARCHDIKWFHVGCNKQIY